MLHGKVLVAQGGGPTAVINQSLVGAVIEARKIPSVERVYGAYHGVRGIINEDFLDLTRETTHNLEMVANTPSSGAGLDPRQARREVLRTRSSRCCRRTASSTFFYIGGNDSSDTARIVSEQARAADYPLRCVHIPKTIDNDLVVNDHTPGLPVGGAVRRPRLHRRQPRQPRAARRLHRRRHGPPRRLPHRRLGAWAASIDDDGPHLIYVPERAFSLDEFVEDVREVYNKYGRCIVAVSEGIHDETGQPIATKLAKNVEKDAHGNVQLSGTGALADLLTDHIKANTNIKRVRGDTFGYLQRSFLGCVSDVDQREAREVGEKAVQYAHFGDPAATIAARSPSTAPASTRSTTSSRRSRTIAGKTKVMPDEFIAANGHDVTDKFLLYLRPLLGSGMPEISRLRLNKVPKILKTD